MKRKTRLYYCLDRLIAAHSLSGAKRIARDCDLPTKGIRPVIGAVSYCDEEGNAAGSVEGEDCSAVWPKPCMVQDTSD